MTIEMPELATKDVRGPMHLDERMVGGARGLQIIAIGKVIW